MQQKMQEIERHAKEGRELYQEAQWPCVLLWRLVKFRPGGVTDGEWRKMTEARLSPIDVYAMYGVLSMWDLLPHYGDEHFGRMHAIHIMLSNNPQAFVKVLREAPEKLGVPSIDPSELSSNPTLKKAWYTFDADEAIRERVRLQQQQQKQ